MFRRALERLAARFGTDGDPDSDGADAGFVSSPLDRSVRYAPGGTTPVNAS